MKTALSLLLSITCTSPVWAQSINQAANGPATTICWNDKDVDALFTAMDDANYYYRLSISSIVQEDKRRFFALASNAESQKNRIQAKITTCNMAK